VIFLNDRLQIFAGRAAEYKCHSAAVRSITTAIKAELKALEPSSPTSTRPPLSPVLSRNVPTSPQRNGRRGSLAGYEDELVASEQLLRNLGINLPSDASEQKTASVLEAAFSERTHRLQNHMDATEKAVESSIVESLKDAHGTLQLLRDCLMEDTLYGSVRMLDADSEELMGVLEEGVTEMQSIYEAVDLEKLHMKNPEKEKFVERWGR
jgi:hypothetical protein